MSEDESYEEGDSSLNEQSLKTNSKPRAGANGVSSKARIGLIVNDLDDLNFHLNYVFPAFKG
jgi:hypothetical protein